MLKQTLIAAVAVAFATTALHADVIETASLRTNYALAAGESDSDGPHTTSGPSIYGDWMDTLTASASDFGGNGDASAAQNSSIMPGVYSADLDVSSSAFSDFFGGTGIAESVFEVEFTVTSLVDFSIDGLASAIGGDSITTVKLVNIGMGGSPSQTFASLVATQNGNTVIDVDGSLLPGDYRLEASAYSYINYVFESGSNATSSATNFTMTLTPEPTSLALLALGACVIRRRRASNA